MKQRPINLNPDANRLEVFKITYLPGKRWGYSWRSEAMRFIHHDGRAQG